MKKTYSEMKKLESFEDRYNYLKLGAKVGDLTFGADRYLGQALYHSDEWDHVRDQIIIRDEGCDLGHPDRPITSKIYVHHINPISKDDILNRSKNLFDPENLVCVSFNTHQAIHYGDESYIKDTTYVERKPNDTCPWRKSQ